MSFKHRYLFYSNISFFRVRPEARAPDGGEEVIQLRYCDGSRRVSTSRTPTTRTRLSDNDSERARPREQPGNGKDGTSAASGLEQGGKSLLREIRFLDLWAFCCADQIPMDTIPGNNLLSGSRKTRRRVWGRNYVGDLVSLPRARVDA